MHAGWRDLQLPLAGLFICMLINEGPQPFRPRINRQQYDVPSKHLSAYCAVSTVIMKPLSRLLPPNASNYNFTKPSHLVKCLSQPITTKSIISVITLIWGAAWAICLLANMSTPQRNTWLLPSTTSFFSEDLNSRILFHSQQTFSLNRL